MTRSKLVGGFLVMAVLLSATPAGAQQPMRAPFRPAEWTDVIDAFDGEDPFDLNLGIGYARSMKRGRIRREVTGDVIREGTSPPQIISGDGFVDYLDIADFTQLTHTLHLELSIGVYHDLEIWTHWPLVLSDTRELDYAADTNATGVRRALGCSNPNAPADSRNPGCLFNLPFRAPERSGIDAFGIGIDWGPLNQGRDRTKPTFVIRGEAWIAIGDPLVADDRGPAQTVPPAGVPANWNGGVADEDAGISRGTDQLAASLLFSHRFRYVEPYTGLRFAAEFPRSDTAFPKVDDPGRLNTVPPLVGSFTAGLEVIPWENPDQFQRFAFDFRLNGEFHSEGRDYSELYDALGTTTSDKLLQPDAATRPGPARDDPVNTWTGQTDVQNYGVIGGSVGLNLQAARYVKFGLGLGFAYVQEHSLTFTDACNPDANVTTAHIPCTEGAPNPDHRPEVDLPGRRLRIEGETIFDVFVNATAMF